VDIKLNPDTARLARGLGALHQVLPGGDLAGRVFDVRPQAQPLPERRGPLPDVESWSQATGAQGAQRTPCAAIGMHHGHARRRLSAFESSGLERIAQALRYEPAR